MSTPAIRTEGLTKRFGDVTALDSLDLEVAPGEVVGYLGPNGAGKTTTIRLLLGLARPSAGRAEIFGLDAQSQTVEVHRRLAYVPGEANLWPSLTGAETLDQLSEKIGLARSFQMISPEGREKIIQKVADLAGNKVEYYKA